MEKDKIRIKDIAELAGVSHGTVDRVIHKRGEVSESTRRKVLQIIEDLDYEPDLLAKTLASKRNKRIAICIPYPQNESSFWQSPLLGIDKATNEVSHLGITNKKFLFDQFDINSFHRSVQNIIEYQPDAMIIAPIFTRETSWFLNYCDEKQIDYVFVNSTMDEGNPLTFIGQDDKQSGKVAGKLMSRCNPQGEILVVHLSYSIDQHEHLKNREKGFKTYFKDTKRVHTLKIRTNEQKDINQKLQHFLTEHPAINGIFVTNSKAFRVARFVKTVGLKLHIIGYDLIEENLNHLEDETISYLISQKPFDQGYLSIRALFNRMMLNKPLQESYKLPIEIIIKENIDHLNITRSL